MASRLSPTVRRRRLGMELRRLREAAGMKMEEAAGHLDCSATKVSRMETGKTPVSARDVRDLLDLYGLEDQDQRELLITIAREAKQRGWWTDYEPVLPAGFDTYVGLETEAASLRAFQISLVPGLLQTEAYARSILRAGRPTDRPEDVERLVELRMRRQDILTQENPLSLWAILDETVLRRQIGGKEVMTEQLKHLIDSSTLPNVTLQILPFARGAHASLCGGFAIIEFIDPTDPDVVYVDGPGGNLYIERPSDVRRDRLIFDHLQAAALAPDESVSFIASLAEETT